MAKDISGPVVQLSVEQINQLIMDSFGAKFKANYYYTFGSAATSEGISRGNKLDLIVKTNPHPFLLPNSDPKFIGIVGAVDVYCNLDESYPRDGSVITVPFRHVREAMKYSQLYQDHTGNRAQIFFSDFKAKVNFHSNK